MLHSRFIAHVRPCDRGFFLEKPPIVTVDFTTNTSEIISQYTWTVHRGRSRNRTWYVRRQVRYKEGAKWKTRNVYLHRYLMGLCDINGIENSSSFGLTVDHIDGDGLNCTYSNMERVTQSVNMKRAYARKKIRDAAAA